jgi:hypothetical protein
MENGKWKMENDFPFTPTQEKNMQSHRFSESSMMFLHAKSFPQRLWNVERKAVKKFGKIQEKKSIHSLCG